MKRSIILLVALTAACSNPNLGPDKVKHFAAGAIVAASVETLHIAPVKVGSVEIPASCIASFGLGIGKEIYDKRSGRGNSEALDALATGMGCAFTWKF